MLIPTANSIAVSNLPRKVPLRQLLTTACLVVFGTSCDDALSVDDYGGEFRSRTPIVDIDRDSTGYLGRWQGDDAWSHVKPFWSVYLLPRVSPSSVWSCDTNPDVDACSTVNQYGTKACFRHESGFAVEVTPACAATGNDWIDVGNDMMARVAANYNTNCAAGSLGCPCIGGSCETGLTCVEADNGATVCALSAATTPPCSHDLDLSYAGIAHDGGCVAKCLQGTDHCGPMECSPSGPFAWGICAWNTAGGGEMTNVWTACPEDAYGNVTACPGVNTECVVGDSGTSNVCLPVGWCPWVLPPIGDGFEVGWGEACYARCDDDSDCSFFEGMVCGLNATGNSMCTWPKD